MDSGKESKGQGKIPKSLQYSFILSLSLMPQPVIQSTVAFIPAHKTVRPLGISRSAYVCFRENIMCIQYSVLYKQNVRRLEMIHKTNNKCSK